MELIHFVFRLLAFSQICFTCLYLLLHQRNRTGAMILAAGLCYMCYLVTPLVYSKFDESLGLTMLSFFATSIPAVLWLLGNRFFNDDSAIPASFMVAAISYLTLWYIGELELVRFADEDFGNVLFILLPQLIKLGIVLHLIYIALIGRQHDLIARRIQLRVPLAVGGGTVAALVIVVELWAAGPSPLFIEVIGSVFMFVVALTINLFLFRWREDFPLVLTSPKSEYVDQLTENKSVPTPDQQTLTEIERQMLELRFYAKHGATLADFADVLKQPAHRLRRLINQHMGFQNFNQFLNHYRILEASQRLRSEPQLPILTIALDVGFKSMSSFNQAFKNAHQHTPSSFREASGR